MARRILGNTSVSMKTMIYGKEGTHKSNIAIQFATLKNKEGKPFRVLLLDLEFKSIEGFNEAWIESKGVDFRNICEIRTRDLSTVQKLFDIFSKGQPIPVLDDNEKFTKDFELDADGNPFIADVIIVDSLSVINDLMIEGRGEIAKKRTNIKIIKEGLYGDEKELELDKTNLQLLDYGKLKSKALKMVRDLQSSSGKHIAYIVRAKDMKESKLVDKKIEVIDLGYEVMDATSFKSFLPYEVNLIVHTKNEKGITLFEIEKDSTGVKQQGEILSEFDMKDYESYINNTNRSELLKVKSYADNLKTAQTFTEDSEEADNDIKLKLYKMIVGYAKDNPTAKALMAKYCAEHSIAIANLGQPELISLDDLTEIRKLLGL